MKLLRICVTLAALVVTLPAFAAQGSGCLPTTGQFSGLVNQNNINAAFAAIISSNSGGVPPATDCTGAPVAGQFWLDTSATPNILKLYDGSSFATVAKLDATGHFFQAPIGGGLGSIGAATTVDLCSLSPAFVTVTGTAAIQSFGGTCLAGQTKWVRFAAAGSTLTPSSVLLLPNGGAPIPTEAGDVATATYLTGGVWQITNYQRASGKAVTPPPTGITGQHMEFWGSACPATWARENGSALSRATYAALFSVVGTTYGAGDGSTTFNLPNTLGWFTRGLNDTGAGLDAGRTLGSYQSDTVGPHSHGYVDYYGVGVGGGAGITPPLAGITQFGGNTSQELGTSAQYPSNTTETRPANIAVLYCIKL